MWPLKWVLRGSSCQRQQGVSSKEEQGGKFKCLKGPGGPGSLGGGAPWRVCPYLKRAAALHSLIQPGIPFNIHSFNSEGVEQVRHALRCPWCWGHRVEQGKPLVLKELLFREPSSSCHMGIQAYHWISIWKTWSQNFFCNLLLLKCWQALYIFKRTPHRPDRICPLTQFSWQPAHLWPLEWNIMIFTLRSIFPVSDFKLILIFPAFIGSC